MDFETYKKGDVIFRQGDFQMWMYYIQNGSVGVYANYGEANEKELTVLHAEEFLGELGLVDSFPRSATAVALENETVLKRIDSQTFDTFFKDKPAKVYTVMQKMCKHIRRLTDDYMDACGTIAEYLEAEEKNQKKSDSLISRMKKFVQDFKNK